MRRYYKPEHPSREGLRTEDPGFDTSRGRWISSGRQLSDGRDPCKNTERSSSGRSGLFSAAAAAPCWPRRSPGWGSASSASLSAFGLTVLTMAYAIGHISGCHLNPAVSIGLWAGGRFPAKDLLPYIVAQVLGAITAGAALFVIAQRETGLRRLGRFRLERLRRPLAGRLLAPRGPRLRDHPDRDVPRRHPGRDGQAGAPRAGPHRHRPLPDPDPPDQHPRDQYLGQSRAQHGRRRLRRGMRPSPSYRLFWVAPIAGAVLGATVYRRHRRHEKLGRGSIRAWRRRTCRPDRCRRSRGLS